MKRNSIEELASWLGSKKICPDIEDCLMVSIHTCEECWRMYLETMEPVEESEND